MNHVRIAPPTVYVPFINVSDLMIYLNQVNMTVISLEHSVIRLETGLAVAKDKILYLETQVGHEKKNSN